jgi:CheY-like chemotaxis protein
MASVIVMDDDPVNCRILMELLTATQHQIVSTTDSQEGEHLLYDTAEPSVVLLNLTMPPPSGVNILERLRASSEVRGRHAIILYSASPRLEAVAREYAANGFLPKPAKASQIIDTVNDSTQALQARSSTL